MIVSVKTPVFADIMIDALKWLQKSKKSEKDNGTPSKVSKSKFNVIPNGLMLILCQLKESFFRFSSKMFFDLSFEAVVDAVIISHRAC